MKFVALLAAFATMSVAPATAARLKCSDRAVVDHINESLNTTATWEEDGEAGNSKGLLRIVGTPKTESTKKNQLVCGIRIQHIFPISSFPTSGTTEILRARLWVNLQRDGTIGDARLIFLESSK
ncbi:exported hypothetical protein [uncultured Pleomorphomonas sp.]|uniref:Uncharacterized protein n=1 Tax=uncultured Pleomorphomonas sp. TaxID=442121 RepID=A0A212LDF9_9HYPH|nr:hypothetical protein [uncultured Pleomorphomonas sp.]SCM75389.1 exported hypothetical protein [uncultured Pleomorphomonas sp.]